MPLVFFALALMFCGYLGRWIAIQKGRRTREGFALGFLLGPFGCLLEALLPVVDRPRRPKGRSYTRTSEPGEMPADWGKPEPDDGVDLNWLMKK